MWLLMYRKKKPNKFYLFSSIYYFIILIAVIVAYNTINSLTDISITQQASRAYRDIYQILSFPSFYFIVISFIRAIGFDVKKFNFSKDLEELEINSEDNEEFEFVLGNDTYKYKRKAHRYLREFKYYIIENKLYISIILGSVLIISTIIILLNITFINHVYKVGETLKTANFTYKLNKAYLTAYDYSGKRIKDDKEYLILDFTINSNGDPLAIKSEEFYVKKNNSVINYKSSLSDSFSDLGISYNGDKISNEKINRIFVFEVDDSNKGNTYILTIFDTIKYKYNKSEYIYQTYKIKPIKIDKIYTEESKDINTIINLNNEIYGNTNITIKNIKIGNTYEYNYQKCDENNICNNQHDIEFPTDSNKNTLMAVEYELNIDQNASIYNTVGDNPLKFFNRFLKVSYTLGDKTYYATTSSKTNSNLNNVIFIDVPRTIQNYDNKNLIISTRSDYYSIPIK